MKSEYIIFKEHELTNVYYITHCGKEMLIVCDEKKEYPSENITAFRVVKGNTLYQGRIGELKSGNLIEIPISVARDETKVSNKKDAVEKGLSRFKMSLTDLVNA